MARYLLQTAQPIARCSPVAPDHPRQIIKLLSFNEMLSHHAAFVLMIVMEWDHFHKCRSAYRKKYVKSLKPGAGVPHRVTCIKLLRVIKALMTAKLLCALGANKADLGDPNVGAQDDIWSMKNCRESYGALRISSIIRYQGALIDVNPLLAFRVFEAASHTGKVIASWKTAVLSEWNLHPVKSVSLWTEDGAANNVKSSKILNANYTVCGPHDMQRANLFALGIAGSTSLNPGAKGLIGRMSKQSSSFHYSGVASKGLQESQVAVPIPPHTPPPPADLLSHLRPSSKCASALRQAARGVKASEIKCTETANTTRWTGIFRSAKKTRLLEPDIKFGLTGDKDGMCGEEPAEIQEESADSASDAEEGGAAAAAAGTGDDAESDAEQVPPFHSRAYVHSSPCTHLAAATLVLTWPPPSTHVWTLQVAANEASGKKFPLAQRCLEAKEFKLVNQLESVVLSSHESVMLMQKGTGVDPGIVFLLAAGCRDVNKSAKLHLVSGAEGKEVWKEVHEASLDPMWRKYRTILSEQLEKRFHINGHPGKNVLLCLKMNPLVDTSASSALFQNKSSVFELCEGEYMRALKLRSLTFPRPSTALAPASPASAPAAATTAITTLTLTATPATQPKKKQRMALSVMGGMAKYQLVTVANTTAVDDAIVAEIAKFESIKLATAAANDSKYLTSGIFNPIPFWNDHEAVRHAILADRLCLPCSACKSSRPVPHDHRCFPSMPRSSAATQVR